ncbi:MAG: porin, partial [Pseudomonadota bacterium]
MKKMLITSIFLLGTGVIYAADIKASAPTVYGLVNKELRYIKQASKFDRVKMLNVQDVNAFPTRLGAKGTVGAESLQASYTLEMGLNSTDTNSSGSVSMRLANVYLNDFWGTAIIGQDYTAHNVISWEMDPFNQTSAALIVPQHSGAGWNDYGLGGLGTK